jgi:dihydrolipoamide dehydrogenase
VWGGIPVVEAVSETLDFDVVVIGSGPGGYKAAVLAARLGARVALVEKHLPGGTCLNQGCVPKKALLHLAGLLEDIGALQGRGLLGEVKPDFPGALRHKDEVVGAIRNNFPFWLRRLGVRVLQGHARFEDPHWIRVEGDGTVQRLRAQRVIIATGSRPKRHPACPIDGVRFVTSEDFMLRLSDLPPKVLCLGGGAVGTEIAFLMHQFGTAVTLVEQEDRLLSHPRVSLRASQALERKLTRLGVEVRKGLSVARSRVADDGVHIGFTDGSSERFDQVLVAIGREPRADDLGLDTIGVLRDADGFVQTSEHLETSVPGIYAVGDVKRGPMTANAALHDAKVAASNAVKGNHLRSNYHRVPIVIDSALEIAAVGLSEDEAEQAGFEPEVARSSLGGSVKSRAHHDLEGFVEVVHDGETGQLLGGCIVGAEAGEQIHMLLAACQSERGLWFFTDMNYSHPSWTEEFENTIDSCTTDFAKSGKDVFRPGIYAFFE